jgi:Predicted membrane protein
MAAFILGIGIFIVFALILEQIMHYIVLSPSADGTIELLSAAPWLYVLYGIFAAGIFEETGRLLAFLITKRHYKDIDSAVSYGIGHGGIEAVAVVGLGMLNGIVLAVLINSGSEAAQRLARCTGRFNPERPLVYVSRHDWRKNSCHDASYRFVGDRFLCGHDEREVVAVSARDSSSCSGEHDSSYDAGGSSYQYLFNVCRSDNYDRSDSCYRSKISQRLQRKYLFLVR